jgi:hypothetical protein
VAVGSPPRTHNSLIGAFPLAAATRWLMRRIDQFYFLRALLIIA